MQTILKGDCIEQSEQIQSGSVDLILTDPPYGTMNGFNGIDWDYIIQPKQLFEIANRILRKNGKLILFSQEPYTSQLITNAIPNVPFSYRMIWEKDNFANALLSKKAPVSYFEDILVFSKNNKKYDRKNNNPLRYYFADILNKYGKDLLIKLFIDEGRYSTGQSAKANVSLKFGQNKTNFEFMTNSLYEYLKSNGIEFDKAYAELKETHNNYHRELKRELNEKYQSTFNLWEGKKYKSNILKYKKDYNGYHPTQKPVALLEDLIKTYSNEGNLVVDLTAGSGSTAVAAINTNRNFVLIEKEEKYYNIAKERIKKANEPKLL